MPDPIDRKGGRRSETCRDPAGQAGDCKAISEFTRKIFSDSRALQLLESTVALAAPLRHHPLVRGAHFLFRSQVLVHGGRGFSIWVESTELLAAVIGVFLLRGHNWARWLAIAWMVFHVVLSAFHSYAQAAVHAAFLVLIAWALFAPGSGRHFEQRNRAEA